MLVHGLALLAVMQASVVLSFKLFLWGLIVLAAVLAWRRWPRQVFTLREQGEDWYLKTPRYEGRVSLQSCRVWKYLTVLEFITHEAGSRHRVLVFPDALPADAFRRLRVRLRYGRLPASHAFDDDGRR